jgi:hypothetical protein
MDNMSQDEYRKMENEKHHPYDKSTKYSSKKSHVYNSPYFLQDSLNKMFKKKEDDKDAKN